LAELKVETADASTGPHALHFNMKEHVKRYKGWAILDKECKDLKLRIKIINESKQKIIEEKSDLMREL